MNGEGRDPVMADGGALNYRCTIPVLGIPVHFESDDPRPIGIAEQAFGAWRRLESGGPIDDEPVRVRTLVVPGSEGDAAHAPLSHRTDGPGRAILTSPGSRAVVDAGRRLAEIRVTEPLLADRQHFRYGLLEAATLCMLSARDRQPVHAAAIARAGAVLLLAGPSGTGKSTLAYAAATRLGCRILAEDVVNVQLRPALRLWGLPGFLHLPSEAALHFPELEADAASLLANGKLKIAVALERIGALPRAPYATRAGICVLESGHGRASLEPLDPATLAVALTERLDPGFDLYAGTIGECVARIAARGGWRLRTTANPADSYRLLDLALSRIAAGAEK